ncbi:inositol monophosphatase family protein [Microbacterium sp. BWT-B31]|uniref:inositol monophosphatase family protein n=1 Tax=Microbacterium sp. BWT-B31 TaxID=3232072 RepID=UPI003527F16B
MDQPRDLEALAREIAREAAELAHLRRTEGVLIAATKTAVADIVTEADREVETLIRARLAEARPGDGFLGEESEASRSTTGITWVVDPIDGTVNYAYGIPAYAISIAAVEGEPRPEAWDVVAGVVRNAATGEEFHAARGEGAWGTGSGRAPGGSAQRVGAAGRGRGDRLAVNDAVGPAGALLGTGFGYDPATHAGDLARLARIMPIARDVRRIGSAALDLASVAAGRLDGYFERGLNPWDHAAGELLVREAGGRFHRSLRPGQTRALTVAAGAQIFDDLVARALED